MWLKEEKTKRSVNIKYLNIWSEPLQVNLIAYSLMLLFFCWQEAPGYGADVMRLWVSSVDYTGDAMIGPQVLRQMSDIYRKLRGTLRYLLGNLHDWHVSLFIIRNFECRRSRCAPFFYHLSVLLFIVHIKAKLWLLCLKQTCTCEQTQNK